MNRLYLTIKYPVNKIMGNFMYFYNDNNMVAIIDIHSDEIIKHYRIEMEGVMFFIT